MGAGKLAGRSPPIKKGRRIFFCFKSSLTFPSPLKEICPDCPGWPKANEYIIRGSPREKKSRDEPRFLYSNVPRE